MKQQLRGQIQRPGQPVENVTLVLETSDPLGYKKRHLNVTSVSGVLTLDLGAARSFKCVLTEDITTIDVNGPMVVDEFWDFHLKFVQESTARTTTWAAKFLFIGGTDNLYGWTIDGGTTFDMLFWKAFV